MTRALTVLALLALASCGPEKQTGDLWRDRPPERFQDNTSAAVVFTSPEVVRRMCPTVPGAVGCTINRTIYVPNPCRWGDAYATLMCHEIGHVNGWSANHER